MKEKLLFSAMVILVVLLASYISILPPKGADTIEFETIAKGQYSGISERGTYIINTDKEWKAFLNKFLTNNINSEIENFRFQEGRHTIIAITMYENITTGYDIEIREVYEFPEYVKLDVIQQVPCAGCILEEKVTRPYHIISIPSTTKEIRR